MLAQDEARTFRHNYIGTEHILLGLLRLEEGLAARVLTSLGVTLEEVRAQVEQIVGQGIEVTSGQIPFTPRAKKVLELSLREALSLGHNYIGTEHILLGLVRERDGVAARILLDLGTDAEAIRDEIIRVLSGPGRPDPSEFEPARTYRPLRQTQWRHRVEWWPTAGTADLVELLDGLGAEGWCLSSVIPGEAGSNLVFARPLLPGEKKTPEAPRDEPD